MLLYKHKGDYLLQFYPQTTISVRDKLEFQHGGDGGTRTHYLCVANASLYRMSYAPVIWWR